MEIISHRGNLTGPSPELENTVASVEMAANFFKVEIDIRKLNGEYFLGHDEPERKVSLQWLNYYRDKLFLHCKNADAYECDRLQDFHRFMHENEDTVTCSRGNVLKHPNFKPLPNSYNMMPENSEQETLQTVLKSSAVCTDYPLFFQSLKDMKYSDVMLQSDLITASKGEQ